MKFKFFSILALAGLLLSSCAVDEIPTEGGSINVEMETDQTRTMVTDEGTFTWSSGDQVWLHTTSGSVVGTLSSGAGSSSAKFTYAGFVGEMTGKAVYPYNDGHSVSEDVLSFVLPASYNLGSSLDNTNAAMYGVNVGGTIKFNHLAGVMRFKFKDVPAGVNRFTITLDKKINGTFTADITADYPIIEASATSTASEKTIILNFNALTTKSDICVYVPLPTGTYSSLELGLYDDGQSVWTYSKPVINTVNRKSLKLMPVVTIGGSVGGDLEGGDSIVNLSENGTANSYIVSAAGTYKFTPAKGNSSESVGSIASAEVLWETFGTDVTPNVGDLVKNVKYENGVISFETPSAYKKGNAAIAAKDASGKILWSWHIWLTDQPEGQVYYNNAGTMMDRNLGATSATPGDVDALGLLYQWGRKDPFLGSSSISSNTEAKSTLTWPSEVNSNSSYGTIAYATANPTTFISGNADNVDWYYTGSSSTDNTRWTTSDSSKSIYDPCPAGWRVPDGGDYGVWSQAVGSYDEFVYPHDSTNKGMSVSGKFGSASTIWYPASGYRYSSRNLYQVGTLGYYWSATPYIYFDSDLGYVEDYFVHVMSFENYHFSSSCAPWDYHHRSVGLPVRCVQVTD